MRLLNDPRARRSMLTLAAAAAVLGLGTTSRAAVFVEGADPTTTFDSLLLDDVTPTGGGDTPVQSNFAPPRSLAINTGTGDQIVTITGIGLNVRPGTSTTAQTVTVNVTYLGADGTLGGSADNVDFGSASATLQFAGTVDQYTAVFDTPLTAQIDAANDRFLFEISTTGDLRLKTHPTAGDSPSGQAGLKLSVGGSSQAVPEPGSFALLTAGGLLVLARRRARPDATNPPSIA